MSTQIETAKDTRPLREKIAEAQVIERNERRVEEAKKMKAERLVRRQCAIEGLRRLGINDCDIEFDERGVATVDGLLFIGFQTRGHANIALLGTCKRCGQEAPSDAIYSLAKAGELLNEFQPSFDHMENCRVPFDPTTTENEPSLAEQLDSLIRRIVQDELAYRER